MDNGFKTYSCRFECSEDYTALVVLASKVDVKVVTTELSLLNGMDTYVEFVSEASLEELRDILRSGQDLHVGLQTLMQCPLKNNPLKRNYDLH